MTIKEQIEMERRAALAAQPQEAGQALPDEQIRFRFFKNLNESERLAVFKAFGVYPDDCTESLNHSIERRLLDAILKRRAAQAAPAVPQGRLIGREPTDAMQAAGAQAIRFDTTVLNKMWTANAVFRAMWDAALSAPAPAQEPEGWRAALLLALFHHQGGSSPVGQPIRKLLGIGQYDYLTDDQIDQARAFAADGS